VGVSVGRRMRTAREVNRVGSTIGVTVLADGAGFYALKREYIFL
jgi:hypothetical protein